MHMWHMPHMCTVGAHFCVNCRRMLPITYNGVNTVRTECIILFNKALTYWLGPTVSTAVFCKCVALNAEVLFCCQISLIRLIQLLTIEVWWSINNVDCELSEWSEFLATDPEVAGSSSRATRLSEK
jgi:hypothetical protein